ncbi:hypothetical protein OO015_10695 [Thermomicrobium sp. 4228-Ro]|uniref:hypothetical protein n=1 Tax=Thermomicrobium sp. 4228-Ro TaxID=2993937 RepID=UPI002248C532|nr:hypothetical protein [Thermomicrobium sp. 4228-Ro]MCX2727957.1 hypothetical protein [Thermomicrobium sp. 4228-Ro]
MRWVDDLVPRDGSETLVEERLPPVIEPVFTRWHVLGIAITVAIALWLWLTGNSRAEAYPVRVILSHVPTVSTFGPPQATGVALITFSEGDVRADLVDLPVLGSNDRYALWLRRSDTGETLLLGKFDASSLPVTHVDLLLPEPIPEAGWDTVLVTVEPEPDPDPAPDSRVVLVGALPGTPVELDLLPPTLPQTGTGPARTDTWGLVAVNSLLLIALGAIRARRNREAETRGTP